MPAFRHCSPAGSIGSFPRTARHQIGAGFRDGDAAAVDRRRLFRGCATQPSDVTGQSTGHPRGCIIEGSGSRRAVVPVVCRRPDDVLWRVGEPAAVRWSPHPTHRAGSRRASDPRATSRLHMSGRQLRLHLAAGPTPCAAGATGGRRYDAADAGHTSPLLIRAGVPALQSCRHHRVIPPDHPSPVRRRFPRW